VQQAACRTAENLRRAEQRAKQVEAAIERVRTLADRWDNALAPDRRYARTLRDALDEPQQPTTAPGEESPLVAHGTIDGRTLLCLRHERRPGLLPIWIDDLDEGGICTECGADVLIPAPTEQQPTTA
jgi:hypothetical protein